MVDDAITGGGMHGLGSSSYICVVDIKRISTNWDMLPNNQVVKGSANAATIFKIEFYILFTILNITSYSIITIINNSR